MSIVYQDLIEKRFVPTHVAFYQDGDYALILDEIETIDKDGRPRFGILVSKSTVEELKKHPERNGTLKENLDRIDEYLKSRSKQ